MTKRLKQAIEKVSKLPAEDQDRIALIILCAVDPWDWESAAALTAQSGQFDDPSKQKSALESKYWFGGRKPSQKESAQAIDRWRKLRKGITLGDDLTIRQLIDEGRR